MRNELRDALRDRKTMQKMREHLVKDITVSPAEVRRYFKELPADSIPFVPTEVEVQILTQTPRMEQEEINRVKDELRDYTDRINKGESSFSTLARLYSEDRDRHVVEENLIIRVVPCSIRHLLQWLSI